MVATFTMICIIGFVFMFLSFVFGHHGDIGHDVALDGHDGGIGHDGGDGGDHGHGHSYLKWLNINVISMFVTAFSGMGAITKSYDLNDFLVYSISLAVAVIVAGLAGLVIGIFQKQQISSHIIVGNLHGKIATVILTIPENGLGEIKLQGGDVYRPARSENGTEIQQGEEVEILSSGSPAIVREMNKKE